MTTILKLRNEIKRLQKTLTKGTHLMQLNSLNYKLNEVGNNPILLQNVQYSLYELIEEM